MNSNHLPVSGGLAVFFAVIISYFIIDPAALDGIRPGADSREIPQVHGIEDVQARLWQDPFAAAAEHQHKEHAGDKTKQLQFSGRVNIQPSDQEEPSSTEFFLKPKELKGPSQTSEKGPHSLQSLQHQIGVEADESPEGQVDVLAVMVSGGPYPEDGETRLRKRYAVIAGLAASGFQPEEAAHIGYVEKLQDATCGDNEMGGGMMPKLMPFEWFKNKDGKYFLALWLDEDALSRNPLCKLNHLQGLLEEGNVGTVGKVSVLGPHGSGTLKGMLAELSEKHKGPVQWNEEPPFPNLTEKTMFFSATATAEADRLLPEDKEKDLKAKASEGVWDDPISRAFLDKFIIFFRTITDDRQLTTKLVSEIEERVTHYGDMEQDDLQVAFVTEWDTLYGRSLPDSFILSACRHFKAGDELCEKWKNTSVFRFSYLRGIDGNISVDGPASESVGKAREGKARPSEKPEGRSQKDYLRRLASEISVTHQKLRNEGRRGIRAIGVLGSDVYDKLLILRALRKQFPKAIFFTTDLDAALLHSEQFPWTRNLLVASSFDLQIGSHSDIRQLYRKAFDESEEPRQLFRKIYGKSQEALDRYRKAFEDSEEARHLKREAFEAWEEADFFEMLLKATERTISQNRDVYQTSVFLSTVWASNNDLYNIIEHEADKIFSEIEKNMDNKKGGVSDAESEQLEQIAIGKIKKAVRQVFYDKFGKRIEPKVYEIGRYGAVDLSGVRKRNKSVSENPFYPAHTDPISPRRMAMIAASVVLLMLVAFLFWYWTCRDGCEKDKTCHTGWFAIGIASIALAGMTYFYLRHPEQLEVVMLLSYLFVVLGFAYLVFRVRAFEATAKGEVPNE